jgi:hypothetical protein
MLWRKSPRDIAKVGVEGSNPFARSNYRLLRSRETGDGSTLSYGSAVEERKTFRSAFSAAEIDEVEGVDRGVPLGLRPLQ